MTIPDALAYLDRRLSSASSGVSASYSSGTTTWTLPYSVAVDGSEGDLRVAAAGSGVVYTSTRPAANQIAVTGQGDLTAAEVIIGVLYPFSLTLSPVYHRDRRGLPITQGRLTVRRLVMHCDELTDLQAVVTHKVGQQYTTTKAQSRALPLDVPIPVHGVNTDVSIEVRSTGAGGCALAGFDWEGTHSTRH